MLVSVLALTACLDVVNDACGEDEYLALNGSCVIDPGAPLGSSSDDTGATVVDDVDDDADASQLVSSVDITCSVDNWTYNVSTSTATESASFEVVNSVTGQPEPPEFHTMTIQGSSPTGGEMYKRDLLLVDGYYQEDVSSQFPCTDGSAEAGTNNELTWKIDLFEDTNRTVSVGCVVLGHDPAAFSSSECMTWTGS